ncbi:hypothetical protein HMPREF1076_02860 [Parabacteroides goldsteinii CL02T12C30]|uniref:HTH cro/C1-type domain-containing protein n=1 Tax=Parabacteroides goldsteinii CL02T12C30 TaxID=999418 RepID=K5ZUF7_9BACT|nr:helix-turn-helix domain-containing protein [Parabacteroides goldsteinii]EKN14955.1 hypothetical protein HMPREF1076_02860 [Parabacteroides goldsteinii CL02T12C30]
MKTIGERIKTIRKQKGLSQELLSERAGINLRTIQRIEKNETTPRGNTLQMLCQALDVPIDSLIEYGKTEDRNYLAWFHLSAIAGLFIPAGQILLPFILWITNRDKTKDLYEQGANMISFQIWWTAFIYLQVFFNLFFHYQQLLMFLYFAGMGTFCLAYPLFISIRIFKGKPIKLFYPKLIPLIR